MPLKYSFLVEDDVAIWIENDAAATRQGNATSMAYLVEKARGIPGLDAVWCLAGQPESEGFIGAMSLTCERKRAKERHLDPLDVNSGVLQLTGECSRSYHRSDGVRGGGTDSDLK